MFQSVVSSRPVPPGKQGPLHKPRLRATTLRRPSEPPEIRPRTERT